MQDPHTTRLQQAQQPLAAGVRHYLSSFGKVLTAVDEHQVADALDVLWDAWETDRGVFLLGNGGSASTASHAACDLVKQTHVPGRKPLRATSLMDNQALVSAYANDISYADVFSEQLRVYASPGDVLVCISCSGRSPNVVSAIATARAIGMRIVALGGCDGGEMAAQAHVYVDVPSHDYGMIESAHLLFEHCITDLLYKRADAARLELLAGATNFENATQA